MQRPNHHLLILVFTTTTYFLVADTRHVLADTIENGHPLLPVLRMAMDVQKTIRNNVTGYTATLKKRERVGGVVRDYEYLFVKVRHEQQDSSGKPIVPFSVYTRFLAPEKYKGREAIYIAGKNNGKMIAHESRNGPIKKLLPSIWLSPDGKIAMHGNRYPITKIGIDNLIAELIVKGRREMDASPVKVSTLSAKVDNRPCQCLQVIHPQRKPPFEAYRIRIFIDKELNIPIRFAAWDWPTAEDEEPEVIEEYTYSSLKINPGLTDADFDWNSQEYGF